MGLEGVVITSTDDLDCFRERAEDVCVREQRAKVFSLSTKRGGETELTVFVGVRKGDHVLRENLWDTADASGDNIEACTGSLEDGDAKGFGEGRVEEDGATDKDLENECQGMVMIQGKGERTLCTSRCRTGPSSSIRS